MKNFVNTRYGVLGIKDAVHRLKEAIDNADGNICKVLENLGLEPDKFGNSELLNGIQWRVVNIIDFSDIGESRLEFEETAPLKHSHIIDRLVCDENLFDDEVIRVSRSKRMFFFERKGIRKQAGEVYETIYDKNWADEAENSIIDPPVNARMPLSEVRQYAKLSDADYEKLIKRLEQGDGTVFDGEERAHIYKSEREILQKFYGIGRQPMTPEEIAAEEDITRCYVHQRIEAALRQLKYVLVK